MKFFLFCIILILTCSGAVAQHFKVVKVFNGEACLADTKELIKSGQKLPLNAPIRFSSLKCIIVFNLEGKGVFTLSSKHDPRSGLINKLSTFRLMWNDLLPLRNVTTPGSRAAFLVNDLKGLQRKLKDKDQPLLIWDQTNITLNADHFQERTHRYFFIRQVHERDTIDKILAFAPNGNNETVDLVLDAKSFIWPGKTSSAVQQCSLYYYDDMTQHAEFVSDIKIRIAEDASLRRELTLLIKGIPLQEREDMIINYLNRFYGVIDYEELLRHAPELFN
jgi:hypothetical protein